MEELTDLQIRWINTFLQSGNIHQGLQSSRFTDVELSSITNGLSQIFWDKGLVEHEGDKIKWTYPKGHKLLELQNWHSYLDWEVGYLLDLENKRNIAKANIEQMEGKYTLNGIWKKYKNWLGALLIGLIILSLSIYSHRHGYL